MPQMLGKVRFSTPVRRLREDTSWYSTKRNELQGHVVRLGKCVHPQDTMQTMWADVFSAHDERLQIQQSHGAGWRGEYLARCRFHRSIQSLRGGNSCCSYGENIR